jgi:hypothetical protein
MIMIVVMVSCQLAREEGPGILIWCIAGLDTVLRDIDESSNADIALSDRQTRIVDSLLAESDSLRFFLQRRIQKAKEDDLFVDEIVEKYAQFCPEMGWAPLPITEIHRSLEGLMLELFHVSKAHSLKRDCKAGRGFRGVGLKPEEPEQ